MVNASRRGSRNGRFLVAMNTGLKLPGTVYESLCPDSGARRRLTRIVDRHGRTATCLGVQACHLAAALAQLAAVHLYPGEHRVTDVSACTLADATSVGGPRKRNAGPNARGINHPKCLLGRRTRGSRSSHAGFPTQARTQYQEHTVHDDKGPQEAGPTG